MWWIDPGTATVRQASQAQGTARGWIGPYPGKAAAQAALAQATGGAGPGGGTGKWWIIQTFFSDGSSSWAVGTARAGFAHPVPTANEIVFGPYPSQAAAQQAVDGHTFDQARQKYYGSNVSRGPGGIPVPGVQAPGVPSGLAAIGGFFSSLGDPHTWLRVAEVLAGLILLAVGLNAILKQSAGVDLAGGAARAARSGAKLAAVA